MCSLWGWRWGFLSDAADRFAEGPDVSRGRSVAFGVGCAVIPLGIGALTLYYVVAYSKGWDWAAFAAMFLALGASLHFYYMWATTRRFHVAGMFLTRLSLVVLVVSLIYLAIERLL